MQDISAKLKEFMECEGKSCSMDMEALHHYTFTGCGEAKCHSMK